MGIFSKKQEFVSPIENTSDLNKARIRQEFGVPIVSIGSGDITKPYIDSNYSSGSSYSRIGQDNLYPSLIDQMYYQSPLHGSLIDFQINAAIGGGYEITGKDKSGKELVEELTFIKQIKLNKLIRMIALDIKMHGRFHYKVFKDSTGKVIKGERIMPSKVRYNGSFEKFWVSDNWMASSGLKDYPAYSMTGNDPISIYTFSNVDTSPGQDVYPLPKEISSFNWIFLDGQSSALQKSNIEKSIWGSLVIKRPKAFESDEERDAFKASVMTKEGRVTSVLVLAADGMENVPAVEAFPANQNDKAFEGMFSRIDVSICQAHFINPVLILAGTGGLGSGSDITAAYPIWEKNIVLPYRVQIEEVVNDIMFIFSITGEFELNNFQIIDGRIQEEESAKKTKEVELAAEKPVNEIDENIKGLSAKENADMYRIVRDYAKGRLNKALASARLMSYGFRKDMVEEILNED
jgi:hypothetical protein